MPVNQNDTVFNSVKYVYHRGRRMRRQTFFPSGQKASSSREGRRNRNNAYPYTENQPKFESKVETFNGGWRNVDNGTWFPNTRYGFEYNALLVSRGNARTKKAWSGGGDFYVSKVAQKGNLNGPTLRIFAPSQPPWTTNPGKLYYIVKPLLQMGLNHPPNFPQFAPASFDTLASNLINEYEATGRARTDPGKPVVDTLQALAELYRDGFRGVGDALIKWRNSNQSIFSLGKAMGGEWLNLNFGVLPTARDFGKAIGGFFGKVDTAMAKLKKESGKTIRRTTTLKDTTTITNTSSSWGYPFAEYEWAGDLNTLCDGYTIRSITTITREKVWYVARYKYAMLPNPSLFSDLVTRAKLLGLVPSASVAWELLPWSWVVDWFTNVGDIAKNMSPSAADNLVCLHSYLMKEVETRTITTYSGTYKAKGGGGPYNWDPGQGSFNNTWEVVTTSKLRTGGRNPYGFRYGWADLTYYQQSILGALGVSRGSFSKKP